MAFKRGIEDKWLLIAVVGVVLFGVVSVLLGGAGDNQEVVAEQNASQQEEPVMADEPGILITREEYGDQWPFTSDAGRIECRNGGALVFVVRDTEYQLNGTAEQMGYTKINSIWRQNPDIPGARIPLTAITQRAKTLC